MKKISDIQQSALSHIFKKLAEIKETQRHVQPYLPEELQNYCQVASFDNGVLKFAVSSSVWGNKLRYVIPSLLHVLRTEADLPQLASINYYIDPALNCLKN